MNLVIVRILGLGFFAQKWIETGPKKNNNNADLKIVMQSKPIERGNEETLNSQQFAHNVRRPFDQRDRDTNCKTSAG